MGFDSIEINLYVTVVVFVVVVVVFVGIVFVVHPRNLPLKFFQNPIINR